MTTVSRPAGRGKDDPPFAGWAAAGLRSLVPADNKTERRMVLVQWLIMPLILAGCLFPPPQPGEPSTNVLYAAAVMLGHALLYLSVEGVTRYQNRLRNSILTATDVTAATLVFYATVARPGYAEVLLYCAVALAATRYSLPRALGITTLIAFLLLSAALLPLHVGFSTLASEIMALYALTYLIGLLSQAEKAVAIAARENAQLAETVLRRNRELNALNRLSRVLSAQTTSADVLRQGTAGIASALDVHNIRAYTVEDGSPRLVVQRVRPTETDDDSEARWRVEALAAIAHRGSVVDSGTARGTALLPGITCLSVPLIVHGVVRAVVQAHLVENQETDVPLIAETLETFCGELAVAMENALLRGEAHRTAILQEKNRIAQELHDTVLQILFSTGLRLQWSLDQITPENPLYGALAEARRLSVRAGEELRGAIFTLSSDIAEIGLVPAIQRLIDDQATKTTWSCNLTVSGEVPALPVLVQNVAHRVVRESLMNAYKHAQASEIIVSVRCTDGALIITVQDNGVGMAADLIAAYRTARDHFGLRSVAEQLEGVGGALTIHSDVDEGGTLIKATIPIVPAEQAA